MTSEYDHFEDAKEGMMTVRHQQLLQLKEEVQTKQKKDVMGTMMRILQNNIEFKTELIN